MRVMALDIGDRRIGVALSDPLGRLATPLTIIKRKRKLEDIQRILELAKEHGVERIVIGLPRRPDSSLGPQAEKVLDLGRELERHTALPVEYLDERLTTVEAERRLMEAGVPGPERRQRVDMVAAAVILEDYLSTLRRERRGEGA